ncbi:unnamed protein product [Nyctereutes procyonoides]|uniref:(raccoon dog) hypothetical protein n=1 Tax=Nyctereutes procyonoides TaxID=34880 RepID=A0A811YDE6_NYCPR|nr:unnamed protein product [Nyctereutes procyonoides]
MILFTRLVNTKRGHIVNILNWKGLRYLEAVVKDGSTEPAFPRVGLLFLPNFQENLVSADETGVFKVWGWDISVTNIKILSKGDNNTLDNKDLYKRPELAQKAGHSEPEDFFLPYFGMVTVIMNDHPRFKYALVAVTSACVLLKHEG